jgi:hypothetical protein
MSSVLRLTLFAPFLLAACNGVPTAAVSHGSGGGGAASSSTTAASSSSSSSSSSAGSTGGAPGAEARFQYGGALDEEVMAVAVDARGRAVLAGTSASATVDYGAGPVAAAGGNLFLAAIARDGTPDVAVRFSTTVDVVTSLALAPDGGYLLTGSFSKPTAFGSHDIAPVGPTDAFVAKTDASGAPLWITTLGEPGAYTAGGQLAVGPGGEVLLATSLSAPSGTPILVAKLDPNGALLFEARPGSATSATDSAAVVSMAVDASGDAVVFGNCAGLSLGAPRDLDGPSAGGFGAGSFAAKLSGRDGSLVWSSVFEGGDVDCQWAGNVVLDGSGDAYVSGINCSSLYLWRLSAVDGSAVWSRHPSTSGFGALLARGPSGEVALLATLNGEAPTFEGRAAPTASYLARYDTAGALHGLWPIADLGDAISASQNGQYGQGAMAIGEGGEAAIVTSFFGTVTSPVGPLTSVGWGDVLLVLVDP